MAKTLTDTGFNVIQANNVNRRTFNQKIHHFISKIQPVDVIMLYYAGYGIEINGQNFLLPTDIPAVEPGQERFVRSESISSKSNF